MKIPFKFASCLILSSTVLIATSSISVAIVVIEFPNESGGGIGGSAGSISAEFSTGNILTGTTGAVAVGKAGAATSASTNTTDIYAIATGYSGGITISGINTSNLSYTVDADPNLGIAQANRFNATPSNVNLVPATVGVTLN